MYPYKTYHFTCILKSAYLPMSVLSGLPIVTLSYTQTKLMARSTSPINTLTSPQEPLFR